MAQTLIQKYGVNKNEQKQNMILLIVGGFGAVVSIILFIVGLSLTNNLKNNLEYLIRPEWFEDEMRMYSAISTLGIVLFVLFALYLLIAIISFVMLRNASLSVYDNHIEGYAGLHWNGLCFKTKSVTLAYNEIASVGAHKNKALQNRYVIVTTKGGVKHTFAVENVEEAIAFIQNRLTEGV